MKHILLFILLMLCFHYANAYDLSGVTSVFNFGTITTPFPDLTLTDSNICVGYTIVVEPSNYHVRATSSGSATTAFQMTNSSNSAYKLNYSVSWAGTSGGSPSFVALSLGKIHRQHSQRNYLVGSLVCYFLQMRLYNSSF